MVNFYDIIEKNKDLDKAALVEEARSISYKDLYHYCNNFSAFLLERGVLAGDCIGIFIPNSLEFAVVFIACLKIGVIAVPINTKFKKHEIEYYIKDSNPKIIFTTDILKRYLLELNSKSSAVIISVKGGSLDIDILKKKHASDISRTAIPYAKAIYLYSTGSTGIPKRISRTHQNLICLAKNHCETLGWNSSEKILFTLPISHTYALGNFIAAINSGMTCYLLEDFNRRKVIETIQNYNITIYPTVPFILKTLAESNIPKEALSSLIMIISAGAPLPRDTFIKFSEKFGIHPRQLYGSSETGVISINLDPDITSSHESVGKPVNEVIVKIVNDDNQEAALNESGEIIVKSPAMTNGYDNLPDETEKVFKNGYYYTGDLGYKDEKGNIYIVGRKKLLINISGNKVDPVEIEKLLNEHPKISESAVTGFTDQSGNESIKSYIVTVSDLSKGEIINYLKGKTADYKIPKSIIFTDKLPKSPTGKILRKILN